MTVAIQRGQPIAHSGSFSGSTGRTFTVDDAATNVTDVLTLVHTTTGTAANGIGTGILFRSEDAGGTTEDVANIQAILTNAGAATEASALAIRLRTGGGALTEYHRFTSGQLLIPAGSLSAPSLAGSTDTDTGVYWTTDGFMFLVSNGTQRLGINTGSAVNVTSLGVGTVLGGGISGRTDASPLTITGGAVGALQGLVVNTGSAHSATSGVQEAARFVYTFAPTSGTAVFYGMNLDVTINQGGGANGAYTALRVAVTETAAGGTGNTLMDLRVGSNRRFAIRSDGAFQNGNSANEATTATAGAQTLPANPQGFLIFYDASGTARKIPYYAN